MRAVINFQLHRDVKTIPVRYTFTNPVKVDRVYTEDGMLKALTEAEESGLYVVTAIKYEAAKLFNPLMKVHHIDGPLALFYYFEDYDAFEYVNAEPLKTQFTFEQSAEEIMKAVETIQEYIKQGVTYQVNYTTRLKATLIENPYALYQYLSAQNGNYTAYIEDGDDYIISISPELFFQYDVHNKQLLTKPMKGTLERGSNEVEDAKNYEQLKNSNKDKAENVMIVDLLRNDLSRIAKKGSVKVDKLFEVERYKTVFQMTSTITATNNNQSLYEIMRALFPCGSITGAPKISTMKIINELESPRGIYCGTIGFIKPYDYMIFNIPIRTIEMHKQDAVYSAGGGITIDSDARLEYEEIVAKTRVVQPEFELIETMRVEDGEIQRVNYHINRMHDGARAFHIPVSKEDIKTYVENNNVDNSMYRVTVNRNGELRHTVMPLPERKTFTAALKPSIKVAAKYHQYKTSVRDHYTNSAADLSLYYDTHILEFNIGNIVYEMDGKYYTPKKNDYILEGCMKQSLVCNRSIIEQDIATDKFVEYYRNGSLKVYMINSLRTWSEVKIIL
ncbi:aminodeoxychorismate synthase component I [Macrococcus armenti]|uniref:aminodeoxychorismate synthase component I n=1 Tax=Macrococcus armenti TaxID=2875764 RepID=UPI001CCFDF6E|nr:aminodeoxychorismate synthase component I [Macrococcus armenti]UBH13648.1 aminodeoxychorismate synthase component I [Macrococcus armenti]